jgi:formamidopyrimidine-DNA glycosylase
MPEICEVTLTSQALKDKLLNKQLTEINVLSGRYNNAMFKGYNKMTFPLKVIDVNSYGKCMWFHFQNEKYLLNTFGLTGMWGFNKTNNSRIEFVFEKGEICAYYEDARNFGTFEYDDTQNAFNNKINKLAPDLLKTNFTKEQFLGWFKNFLLKSSKRKHMPIVKVLMNQNEIDGIGSGLGNYLVPEILYRCKISPHRKLLDLSDAEIKEMATVIKYVLKQCYISNDTGYMKDIKDFIKEHYDGINNGKYPDYHTEIQITHENPFIFFVYRQKVDPYGNKVIAEKILKNRSTYWVPNIQI